MKDIILKIIAKQYSEGSFEEQMELITEGNLYDKDGSVCLEYKETDFDEDSNCIKRLLLKEKSIEMSRINEDSGEETMKIEFEEGKRIMNVYETPFGMFDLEILTKEIKNDLDAEGLGTMTLDYFLSLSNLQEGRNILSIEIFE